VGVAAETYLTQGVSKQDTRHGDAGQPTGSRVGSVGLGGRWQSGQQQRKGSGGRTGAEASSAG